MKAAIFNPYLDTLGGGERYTAAVAQTLIKKGFRVDIQWKHSLKEKLEERFGINLEGVNFVGDVKRGDGYDVCFWVSDGSIPTLLARKNFLHFQVPFTQVNGRSLLNKMKLFRISKVICNSRFTKSFIDKEYGVESVVVYPPVPVEQIKPKRKENIILFVGRFSQLAQVKRQDVLISAFRRLYNAGFDDWRLVLVGGVEVGAGDFVWELKKKAEGYPVEIMESPDFKELVFLYGKSRIFWSAAGFGINEEKEPVKVEHFGITLLEAMAGGSCPIAFRAGGHKEIIKEGINGFLWESVGELLTKTKKLIKDRKLLRKFSLSGINDSKNFGYDVFEREFSKVVNI